MGGRGSKSSTASAPTSSAGISIDHVDNGVIDHLLTVYSNNQAAMDGHYDHGVKDSMYIKRQMGVPYGEALDISHSIDLYKSQYYSKMRHDQRNGVQNTAVDRVEKFLDKMPRWGSTATTYRGMTMSDETIAALAKGVEFDMGGISSWTTHVVSAASFANDLKGNKVVVMCDTQSKGVDTMYFDGHRHEFEVTVSNKARYRATSITKSDEWCIIEVEEV